MTKLKPCPFCGVIPTYYDMSDYRVKHKPGCYLAIEKNWVFSKEHAAWNRRADGWISVDDCRFLLSLIPLWAKEDRPGLDPTMYGTGSHSGDLEIIEKVRSIERLIGGSDAV